MSILDAGIAEEYEWLKCIYDNLVSKIDVDPWSKHHSNKKRLTPGIKGYHSLIPLINKSVNSLPSQHHCMEITQQSTNYLNPWQTPVDVCDQPVFALTREIPT